jgi:CDP-diglyceride synthetase
MLGALVMYFIYAACMDTYGVTPESSINPIQIWLPIFLGIGLLGAIATAFGDLVESCIKRKVGLKDMGNIMPGHGGALDRLDGVFFTSLVTYIAFIVIYMIF